MVRCDVDLLPIPRALRGMTNDARAWWNAWADESQANDIDVAWEPGALADDDL
jgi:hypothetical protein